MKTNEELLAWASEEFERLNGSWDKQIEVAKVLAQCLATQALERHVALSAVPNPPLGVIVRY